MKGGRFVLSAMVLVLVLSAVAYVWASTPEVPRMAGVPVPMLINYQGVLTDPATGKPVADGSYAVTFSLYDVPSGGIALWSETQTVTVEKGLFNVLLGNVNPLSLGHFTGTTYLGIKVETDPEMTPRHQVVSVAYALYAREAVNADTLDGEHASAFADATHNHDDRYWSLTGNAGTVSGEFLGTTDSMALELGVNGARALRLEPNATSPNLIGGHSDNDVTAGVVGATIGGGGASGDHNSVTDDYGTVGGGKDNRAGDGDSDTSDQACTTVSGGCNNIASNDYATVGGGYNNQAMNGYATVGGGGNNVASGTAATVGGGGGHSRDWTRGGAVVEIPNVASGGWSTVSGGASNVASGKAATVGGGGGGWHGRHGYFVTTPNTASGEWSTVSGGGGNTASGLAATVGGGGGAWFGLNPPDELELPNVASGDWSTVGGGGGNTASGQGATVGGGGGVYIAPITGSTAIRELAPNTASGDWSTVSGGANNIASDNYATIGGGQSNEATAGYATIAGGGRSDPDDAATANRATDSYGTVGGGGNNRAGNANTDLDDAAYAAVAGGENNIASGRASAIGGGSRNTASGRSAAIGGGRNNIASAQESTIGGGERNTASGYIATVGGGYSNEASGNYTAISGGFNNTASGVHAAIGGGHVNTASGPEATVPGGGGNLAQGAFSLAAGRDAQALHDGAFVWADSIGAPFASFRTNQFRARANGGVRFDVNNNRWVNIYDDGYRLISTQTGAYLSTGGVWTNASDREQKENFTPVNAQAVLARLAGVPITTWNYKAQEPTIRHMGPMAQDFYAAFGLGEDDRHISTVDANGVALAAIQGLHQLMQEKDAQIASLQAKVQSQQAELDDLKARVERLEQRAASGSAFPLKGLFPFLAGAGTLIALAVSGSFHIRARK